MLNSEEGANAVGTTEAISLDDLHCLGHISHDRAKLLISKGLIVGINLEADSKATVCESCEFAKGMRKAITKVRDGERCAELCNEIHSDLWGSLLGQLRTTGPNLAGDPKLNIFTE